MNTKIFEDFQICISVPLSLFWMGFSVLPTDERGGGGAERSPFLKSVKYILQWWHLANLTLPKEDPENILFRDISLEFCWHQHFFTRKQQILIYQEIDIDYILIHNLYFLKIKILWNKGYDIITSVHDITNKFLSRDSNYTVDVVMWSKFGNSSISVKEVIIPSILQGFDQKNRFFWRVVLVQVQ